MSLPLSLSHATPLQAASVGFLFELASCVLRAAEGGRHLPSALVFLGWLRRNSGFLILPTEASTSLREAVARLLNSLSADAYADAAASGSLITLALPEDTELLGFAPMEGALCTRVSASPTDMATARRARLARVAAFGLWAAARPRWTGPPAAEWHAQSGLFAVDGAPLCSALEQEMASAAAAVAAAAAAAAGGYGYGSADSGQRGLLVVPDGISFAAFDQSSGRGDSGGDGGGDGYSSGYSGGGGGGRGGGRAGRGGRGGAGRGRGPVPMAAGVPRSADRLSAASAGGAKLIVVRPRPLNPTVTFERIFSFQSSTHCPASYNPA